MNKDGFLSLEDFDIWCDNLEREVKPDAELMKKARKATREYYAVSGLKPGVFLTKEQFVNNMAELCAAERARYEQGKFDESVFFKYIEALFDLLDTDGNNFLDLNEYEKMMKACNFDVATAKVQFDIIDTNHDEKLSREELREYNFKFWYIPDDTKAAGLYGPKF